MSLPDTLHQMLDVMKTYRDAIVQMQERITSQGIELAEQSNRIKSLEEAYADKLLTGVKDA